jgi:hypothetical protein
MSYDSLTNRADYLSPHYLAEVLPRELAKKDGLRAQWAERDKEGTATPVKELRALRRSYFAARPDLADFAQRAADGDLVTADERRTHDKAVKKQNDDVLRALGFAPSRGVADVERSGETFGVPVACQGQNVVAIDCGWAADTDAALDADQAGLLLDPVETGSNERITTGAKLARWMFDTDEPPRYVLLVHGGVVILADRVTWAEGRYLAVSLDTAIDRADQAELETIAALFSADVLQPPAEGGSEQLAHWVDESRKHAVGVSGELREGLRESVQIIANEVLDRIRSHGLEPGDVAEPSDLAKQLGREALRYLYRILFLLYAESRPELGILPTDDQDYIAGYSMQRLGELVARRLIGEEARIGFHLYESLDLLFRMVNSGHRARGNASTEGLSEGDGIRFESLKADLFEPSKTRLIGRIPHPRNDDSPSGEAPLLDTRLRDEALYKVLRRLMLAKGSGGRGKNQRGGFISYAQLGINQLGAVYEGLMSYTGFIATEELYEVAKKGDPSGGSWMIPASKVPSYTDDVFVMEKDENGFQTGERVRYRPGAFVYRLASRDRQTSASYYTPHSLTSVTVQLALEQRVKEEDHPVTAAEVLRWRVCEPALGSGAFLNEAIDQLAALYLRLREKETGDRLEPDEHAAALQKIKAYIALHNCYGVDLNETAVELAEVSIWLNVMHRGLQAPWFGLHLVRGNSLIGTGRRLYSPDKLAKGEWLKAAPTDVPFSAGAIPAGHIHHFLLPAEGWAAVAGEKEAKELAPEDTKRLADWRKAIRKPPSPKKSLGHKASQVQRLQDLADRTEYLWSLVVERLRISEREISRTIDVWGAEDLPVAQEAKPRDEILADLTSPGTPFWRLKTVMDAWCALWFWPVDKARLLDGSDDVYATEPVPEPVTVDLEPVDPSPVFPNTYVKASLFEDEPEQLTLAAVSPRKTSVAKKLKVTSRAAVPLKGFEDWLEFAESVLGRQGVAPDSLASHFTSLSEMEEYEDKLESDFYMHMDPVWRLGERFPWLDTVEQIAGAQGFFHWELRFAAVFAAGGFDIQVGNPPWVRPRWEENPVLAEHEPWFELAEKVSAAEHSAHKARLLSMENVRKFFVSELTDQAATNVIFLTPAVYDLLVGTQPDFYRAFMIRTWRNIGDSGAIGLVHPNTHFSGVREGLLRAASYKRLRVHGDFVNAMLRFFADVSHVTHFGVHIYGKPQEIKFAHLSWLVDAAELTNSLALAEAGQLPAGWGPGREAPGIRYKGEWDGRPHPSRVVPVDREVLALWSKLSGDEDLPVDQAQLLSPVSVDEQGAIGALARHSIRIGDFQPQISRGYEESSAKKDGLIRYDLSHPGNWSEVILKGIQIGLANPIFKSPTANSNDPVGLDLLAIGDDATPETEYRRACDLSRYQATQDHWVDHVSNTHRRYTEFYRLAWRRQIAPNTERSLFPAIIPPGPAHVHLMHSMAFTDHRLTALASGFWCSLPLDYFVRITQKSDLQTRDAKTLLFGSPDHPLAPALLVRTMRLNCLTNAYAELWADLYANVWREDSWACSWGGLPPLGEVSPAWERGTPLRTERSRRSALVEIDALVAVWLGMDVEALIAIYQAAFPVLNRYEDITWFDADGWKLAGYHRTYGQIQKKTSYDEFLAYNEDPAKNPPPDGYTPPFYKADRIAEYRQAHAVFSERLRKAQGEGDTR